MFVFVLTSLTHRHHIGYVTSSQFGQCLGYLELPVSKEEGEVLRKAFSDARGFNYLRFLDHVECMEEREVATHPSGEQRKEVQVKGELWGVAWRRCGVWPGVDVECVAWYRCGVWAGVDVECVAWCRCGVWPGVDVGCDLV